MEKTKVIAIDLDRERHLRFDLNALELIEDITGLSVAKVGENMKMGTLKAMLYAGLKWEDKSLKIEDVGAMVSMENLEVVSTKLGECFGNLK